MIDEIELAVRVQPIAQKQVDKDDNYYITVGQLHDIIKSLQSPEGEEKG